MIKGNKVTLVKVVAFIVVVSLSGAFGGIVGGWIKDTMNTNNKVQLIERYLDKQNPDWRNTK